MRANLYVTITGSLPGGKVVNETIGGVEGTVTITERDAGPDGRDRAVSTWFAGGLSTAGLQAMFQYGASAFGKWQMLRAAMRALFRPYRPVKTIDPAKEA